MIVTDVANRVVIAGGTGFLGSALAAHFARENDVVLLTRDHRRKTAATGARLAAWTPDGMSAADGSAWGQEIDGAAAVVNLAGESIAARRWTSTQKQRILDSRVQATRTLVDAIRAAASPPPVFVSASAVGYYGLLEDRIVDEDAPSGDDFLARVCVQWEAEAGRAESPRTRVVCVRTGLPLAKDGGALPPMLLPFRFGVGGPMGSGRQYWPWIHRDDWVAMVAWAMRTPGVSGALNATGPQPAPNREFVRALGRALHRPAFMPAPAFALKLLLGEMAGALVLSGQRAVPAKAQRLGFVFRYPDLDRALQAIFA